MAEPQQPWLNAIETIVGIIVGVIGSLGAVFGWLNNRLSSQDKRIAMVETSFVSNRTESSVSIGKLEAYHQSNSDRLQSIEDSITRIHDRLDDVLIIKGRGQ